ncbi:MAG: hypothetical protein MJ198_05330 [Bacteroidales bacterium]|nr:hypothetical protein [Bacteroidales bacterium]
MKKLLLIPFVILMACSSVFSQGTIKNNSYFNLTWIRPIADYGTIVGQESPKNLLKYYKNKSGDDLQHYSGALNVGANFYIHPIGWLIEGFKAGLCVDFIDLGIDYYRFSDGIEKNGKIDTTNFNDLTASYSLNLGLVATISPVKNFYIDLTAKLCPTFAVNYFRIPSYVKDKDGNFVFEYRNPDLEYGGYDIKDGIYNVPTKESEDTGIGLGVDYSFGFNIRYSKLSVGCEWLLGNLNYSYDSWDAQKIHNQRLKVKIGLSFE